jgi:predicted MPP superfamily phosphohydrolase
MASFIKKIKSLSPDILFFAGDLVTRGTSFIDEGVDVLCTTKARLARIACVGDHDIWSNAGKIADGLQKCGWGFLDNGHQVVSYKGAKILVTGVSYVYSKRISPPELQNLLETAPVADVKIILVHQPSKLVIKTAAKYGYHLLLAGHTHGGQIILKPFGITITPTQFENDLYSGIAEENQMKILITEGIGVSIIPLRYRAQGEIVQFKLINEF